MRHNYCLLSIGSAVSIARNYLKTNRLTVFWRYDNLSDFTLPDARKWYRAYFFAQSYDGTRSGAGEAR